MTFFDLQVSVIKVKIHEATGMPAGKQKLQYEVSKGDLVLPLGSNSSTIPETICRVWWGETWV